MKALALLLGLGLCIPFLAQAQSLTCAPGDGITVTCLTPTPTPTPAILITYDDQGVTAPNAGNFCGSSEPTGIHLVHFTVSGLTESPANIVKTMGTTTTSIFPWVYPCGSNWAPSVQANGQNWDTWFPTGGYFPNITVTLTYQDGTSQTGTLGTIPSPTPTP